jgi:hypothetical protein
MDKVQTSSFNNKFPSSLTFSSYPFISFWHVWTARKINLLHRHRRYLHNSSWDILAALLISTDQHLQQQHCLFCHVLFLILYKTSISIKKTNHLFLRNYYNLTFFSTLDHWLRVSSISRSLFLRFCSSRDPSCPRCNVHSSRSLSCCCVTRTIVKFRHSNYLHQLATTVVRGLFVQVRQFHQWVLNLS